MLWKVSISSCSEHCPQTLSMVSNTHTLLSLLHSRESEDLKDNCMSPRGLWRAESQDCYPLYGRAKNNSAFHWDVTVRRDGTQFPCKEWSVFYQDRCFESGLQVCCWAVFFCFLPCQLREVHVHIYIQHCLHPRTTPAWEAMLARDKLAGLLRSHHVTIKWSRQCGDPKLLVWASALSNDVQNAGEQSQDQKALPTRRQEGHKEWPPVGTGFGGLGFFSLLLETNTSLQPSSFTTGP